MNSKTTTTASSEAGHTGAFRLSRVDANAVDLVLDGPDGRSVGKQQAGLPGGSMIMSGFTTNGSDAAERVDATERLLKLLDYLPADEPPASLLSRTLGRVDALRKAKPAANFSADAGLMAQPGGISARTAPNMPDAPDGA